MVSFLDEIMKKIQFLLIPVCIAVVISLMPVPKGLSVQAWYYFSIFVAAITGLIIEPLPGAVIGLLTIVIIAVLAPWVLFTTEQIHMQGFHASSMAFKWAVSGFSNSTVWLIFSAFMFALGYEKTGLGQRISLWLVRFMGRRTLTLGYAISVADLIIAPFTPSNTARSAGTIYPVIRNLPGLYDSHPNDPSARKIGAYLMWVSISITCITSTMFLSALAPNLLAVALIQQQTELVIKWSDWFIAMLPVGVLLWLLTPLLVYWIYPPEIKRNDKVPEWAAQQLSKQGPLSLREGLLIVFVVLALILWVGCSHFIDPAISSLIVISLMLVSGVISWSDVVANKSAWNTFFWFATLVALASGLSQVGFVHWMGWHLGHLLNNMGTMTAIIILVVSYYIIHYFFASGTAHVTALIPLILAVAVHIPGVNMLAFSLLLCGTQGLMGILTPYATGPSPIYYGSGYIKPADYWLLGTIFGCIYLVIYMVIEIPWITMIWGFN